jgi:hypothetical protein
VAAEQIGIQRELAALREGQDYLIRQLELIRRELREDIRDLRTEVVAIRNGQFAFAAAVVAGLLGVIATLLFKV